MPDPNNPLSYIGASNDPSLTQRTVDTNRSLQEMRRNLGQIAETGRWEELASNIDADARRNVARIQSDAATAGDWIGAGVSPYASPVEQAQTLSNIQEAINTERLASGWRQAAEAGMGIKLRPSDDRSIPRVSDAYSDPSVVPTIPTSVRSSMELARTEKDREQHTRSKKGLVPNAAGGWDVVDEQVVTERTVQEKGPTSTESGQVTNKTTVPELNVPVNLVTDEETATYVFNIPEVQQVLEEQGTEAREMKVWEDGSNYYVNFNGTGWIGPIPK